MSKPLKPRRGSTAQHASFIGEAHEVTYDTDKQTLVCHDGLTAGGFPLAQEGDVSSLDTTLRALIAEEVGDAESAASQQVAGLDATLRALIAEEVAKYLPLAGGTVSGRIKFANNPAHYIDVDANGDLLIGGNGSLFRLRGLNSETNEGGFQLRASNGTTSKYLIASADDGVAWDGKAIELVDSSGDNWIRFASGLQIIWKWYTAESGTKGGQVHTFPVAFSGTNYSLAVTDENSSTSFVSPYLQWMIYAKTSASFKVALNQSVSSNDHLTYIAVGRWK